MTEVAVSEWFQKHFGEKSVAVMKALVDAGQAAHVRGLDAKEGSGLSTNDAYGTTWLTLPEEVCGRLGAVLSEIDLIRPYRSRYKLPKYRGRIILPVRVAESSTGPNDIRLRTSNMRKRIFELETRTTHTQIDFGADFQFEVEDVELGPSGLEDADGILLIAYELSARSGLQHVWMGEAVLAADGHVNWIVCEELPINSLSTVTALTLVDDDVPRFDDAPIPVSELGVRKFEDSLLHEEQNPTQVVEDDLGNVAGAEENDDS